MRNPFESTGIVVRRSGEGGHEFLGSCFAFLNQKWFLTAAHVVGELGPREIGIGLFFDQPVAAEEGLDVRRIHRHDTTDLAIIELDLPENDPIQVFDPFMGASEALELGDELMSFGFPTQSAEKGVVLVPRMLRGHVQRHYLHASPYGFEYPAFEVSFSAPAGMSGSPISLESDRGQVVGLLAEDFQSSTVLHSIQEVEEDGVRFVDRAHAVINYGVAVDLRYHLDWIREETGACFDS